MKKLLCSLLCCILLISCLGIAVHAEEDTPLPADDTTFDFSSEQQKIEELGILTTASVDELKKNADALWTAKDYKSAAEAYAVYAKQANWIANIISAGLEPFYGASYDNRKDFYPKVLNFSDLSSAESKANEYKGERNRAMLYEGLCYYNINEYETALPLIIKALELIDIKDEENWKLGMETLYSIVGYK